jgi:hypothetical protein
MGTKQLPTIIFTANGIQRVEEVRSKRTRENGIGDSFIGILIQERIRTFRFSKTFLSSYCGLGTGMRETLREMRVVMIWHQSLWFKTHRMKKASVMRRREVMKMRRLRL